MKALFSSLCLFLALASMSCQDINSNTYSTRGASMPSETLKGVIESARVVNVQSEGNLGAVVGAAAGAIGGSNIGGGTSEHVLGAIGGGVLGGLAGQGIAKSASKKVAMEYIVRTEDGQLHTIVQGAEPPTLPVGQPVYVQLFGADKPRVIPR